jgi:hypothetical protein
MRRGRFTCSVGSWLESLGSNVAITQLRVYPEDVRGDNGALLLKGIPLDRILLLNSANKCQRFSMTCAKRLV